MVQKDLKAINLSKLNLFVLQKNWHIELKKPLGNQQQSL